jgi:hypothetical protein
MADEKDPQDYGMSPLVPYQVEMFSTAERSSDSHLGNNNITSMQGVQRVS